MTSRASAAPRDHSGGGSPRATEGVVGVVLCGGQSRRMGFDKGAAELDGSSLVERAAALLAQAAELVVLASGSEARYAELGLPRVADDPSLRGPAAGVVAALEASGAEWALVLACDMPRVDGELLAALLERARSTGVDACLLESSRGEEPLCGVYRRTLVPALRAAQGAGRLRACAFRDFPCAGGELPRIAWLRERELGPEAELRDRARNLNTPDELAAERRRLAGEGPT